MKWRFLLAVFTGLSITDVASLAQGPLDGRRPSSPSPRSLADGYFASAGVVRFQLLSGRLELDPPRHRKGAKSREADGIYESISVTAERGVPSLHYVCHTSARQLTLSVQDATELRYESWMPRISERSVLEQSESGLIRWTITRGGSERSFEGQTLLHIRLQAPEAFDAHHEKMIAHLLRGRSLRSISEETRRALLEKASAFDGPTPEEIAETIESLAASKRSTRIAAERRLLDWGTLALPVLETLSRRSDALDAEQRARLSLVRRRLRAPRDDTPASLAAQLIIDRDFWRSLASELAPQELELANRHLTDLGLGRRNGDGGLFQ